MNEPRTPSTSRATADFRLAGAARISADAIICVDQSQRITDFNEGAEKIFGYPAEAMIGKPLEILIPERYRPTHAAHVREFGGSGVKGRRMGERGQIVGLRSNGEEFPAEAAISHLKSEGADIYSVVLRDITERHRALETQEFLAHAGERLSSSLSEDDTFRNVTRLAVPYFADACVVNSDRGGSLHAIGAAHVDAGRAKEIERNRREHPIDPDSDHPVAQVIRSGRTIIWSNSPDVVSNDHAARGEVIDVFDSPPSAGIVIPLVARGQRLGVLSFYRREGGYDKNDLFLAEELARRAGLAIDNARLYDQVNIGIRARDDIIGIVSHDLRNPVNAVKMLTGVILGRGHDAPLPSEVVEHVFVIRQAAEQMDGLIKDLLDVTRIEAGQLAVDMHGENTEDLLSDALRTLAPVVQSKSLTLRLSAPDDLPDVNADRERIAQVLSNLVGNAVKFSPAGATITVRVAVVDLQLVISVGDTGQGMTPEQLSHAFDRFWQSSRSNRHGAGLGLAITKGIVEAHGGRIWAESLAGAGSTFYFTLPLARP